MSFLSNASNKHLLRQTDLERKKPIEAYLAAQIISMKHLALLAIVIFALSASAQTSHTVLIRPHFNGDEASVGMTDSTSAAWSGNPFQYIIDSNSYGLPEMPIFTWTNNGCPIFSRVLIHFADLSNNTIVPLSATITSATLYLYGEPTSPIGNYGNSTYDGSPYNVFGHDYAWVYELSNIFNAHTVTWRNQPAVKHTDSVFIPATTSQWNENDTINVTSLVQDLHTHGNTGFLIKLEDEGIYRMRLYASCFYSDSTFHPMLKVTFKTVDVPNLNNNNNTIILYPNPTKTDLHLNIIASLANKTNVTVFDATGRMMYASEQSLKEGDNFINVDCNNWPAGVYVVETFSNGYVERQRFTKL
jgi:hypothetical protein